MTTATSVTGADSSSRRRRAVVWSRSGCASLRSVPSCDDSLALYPADSTAPISCSGAIVRASYSTRAFSVA